MRRLMSDRFLQTNHGQMLYQEYRRKLESKQLFQGNFDSQYNSYIDANTNYLRNMSKDLLSKPSSID
ncbi:hypothetical protein RHGRI_025311 [Rhododendron griersonianum]|uniref:Uncharacterized protein n=1 Tax=Rhododendron griersonianum TaxID=479676 RepID=A0AAV6INR8_9ERIC|nr:hypothetical protein RHGRI_025311 [Rhododendron griersonianum]